VRRSIRFKERRKVLGKRSFLGIYAIVVGPEFLKKKMERKRKKERKKKRKGRK
jgi:hypothetical protein